MPTAATSAPPASAAASGWLEVGHGHRLWYAQSGAADGVPVVSLHGGPGSASTPRQREIFDAGCWRIVQFDQRGCGRSTPLGETAHNHTGALLQDIEALREHLGIERWLVSGGSWGSALALAYAARHPERVCGLLLRGMFLAGRADLDWFFHDVAACAPQANAQFLAAIPRRWQRSVPAWLDRCFSGGDGQRQWQVAAAWQRYEMQLDHPAATFPSGANTDEASRARLIAKYRVQAHYLARRCFLGEDAVMRAAASLRGIPVALVHGTRDLVCRPGNAWRVQRAIAGSRLAWAEPAAHDPFHPSAFGLLRAATDAFARTRDFSAWPDAPA
jgi:proline iminopeptidase